MSLLTFATVSAVLAVPHEHHIDCSGWPGVATTEFEVRITAKDGTVFTGAVKLAPGSTPAQARDLLWTYLSSAGYSGRTVGKGIIVLERYKKSPICSVEFKSKDWKPDVRLM